VRACVEELKRYARVRRIRLVLSWAYFQPVDLLPFSLHSLRRHLATSGDLTGEDLARIRQAEEERRGKSEQKRRRKRRENRILGHLEACREVRRQLISQTAAGGGGGGGRGDGEWDEMKGELFPPQLFRPSSFSPSSRLGKG